MDELVFLKNMEIIISALKEAGYDPYEQMEGYLQTGQDYYITRINDARNLIKSMERDRVRKYVDDLRTKQ